MASRVGSIEDEIGLDEIRNCARVKPHATARRRLDPRGGRLRCRGTHRRRRGRPRRRRPHAEGYAGGDEKSRRAGVIVGSTTRVPEPEPTLAAPEEAAAATRSEATRRLQYSCGRRGVGRRLTQLAAVPAELSSEDAAPQTEEKKEA